MATVDVKLNIPVGLDEGAVLLSEEVLSAIRNSSLSMEREAKKQAPVDTGHLRRSINSTVTPLGNKPTGIVSAPVKYAPYVEYGTGVYASNGNGRKTPWVYKNRHGQFVFTRGNVAQPFMRPAFELKKGSAKERMHKALDKVVERMTR